MHLKDIRDIRHWIFDMDGTLTLAVHDFDMIKRVLNIPEDEDILVNLNNLPEADRDARLRWLAEYELKLAKASIPAQGSVALLNYLKSQDSALAILTRNLQDLAIVTLDAIDVLPHFETPLIFGRESAAPKPSPEGILQILKIWGIEAADTVIVGDHAYDLASGKNAGIQTILVNHPTNIYPHLADHHFSSCEALLEALKNPA